MSEDPRGILTAVWEVDRKLVDLCPDRVEFMLQELRPMVQAFLNRMGDDKATGGIFFFQMQLVEESMISLFHKWLEENGTWDGERNDEPSSDDEN